MFASISFFTILRKQSYKYYIYQNQNYEIILPVLHKTNGLLLNYFKEIGSTLIMQYIIRSCDVKQLMTTRNGLTFSNTFPGDHSIIRVRECLCFVEK